MTKTLHGTIRGKMIELDQDPGVEEGQAVEIQLTTIEQPKPSFSAADLLNSGLVGLWADRADIGESADFARQLRQAAQTRRRDV